MLHKEKSKKIAALKYGIAVPLFAAMVVFSSAKIEKNNTLKKAAETVELSAPIETINEKLVKPIQISISKKLTDTVKKKTPKTIKDIQLIGEPLNNKKPLYVIDGKESSQEAFKLLKPDDIASIDVIKDAGGIALYGDKGKDGVVLITTKLGKSNFINKPLFYIIDGIASTKEAADSMNPSDIQSITILKGEKAISLYGDKGKDGVIEITTKSAPTYAMTTPSPKSTQNATENMTIYDFVSIDHQPDFPGGMTSFYKYVGDNTKYPKEAKENNIQGKVFLEFVVEKDGKLTDIRVIRGLGHGLDEEATRIIKESPKWKPGSQNGKPVRVKFNITLNFALYEKAKP